MPLSGTGRVSQVDLAGDRGGDESGAAFAAEFDELLGFGDQGIDLVDSATEPANFIGLDAGLRDI